MVTEFCSRGRHTEAIQRRRCEKRRTRFLVSDLFPFATMPFNIGRRIELTDLCEIVPGMLSRRHSVL